MHGSDLGDHIGMESCIDLEYTDIYAAAQSSGGTAGALNRKPYGLHKRRSSMSGKTLKHLPPPLPIQTSTVLKRYHSDDGRLIIVEEKIDSRKYHFTAHRSNGRLTLQLSNSELSYDQFCRSSSKVRVDSDGNDDVCGGIGKCIGYNAAVCVAAAGPCLFVDQNRLHAVRPVKI